MTNFENFSLSPLFCSNKNLLSYNITVYYKSDIDLPFKHSVWVFKCFLLIYIYKVLLLSTRKWNYSVLLLLSTDITEYSVLILLSAHIAQYWYCSVLIILSTDITQYWYYSVLSNISTDIGEYWCYSVLVLPSTDITQYWY